MLITAIVVFTSLPSVDKGEKYEMESKYKLFLMFLPFIALAFVFCYLPLYGWRYAFFDYKSGDTLSMSNFVGFKWFTYLFQNSATRTDMINTMRNTLIMSFLGVVYQLASYDLCNLPLRDEELEIPSFCTDIHDDS